MPADLLEPLVGAAAIRLESGIVPASILLRPFSVFPCHPVPFPQFCEDLPDPGQNLPHGRSFPGMPFPMLPPPFEPFNPMLVHAAKPRSVTDFSNHSRERRNTKSESRRATIASGGRARIPPNPSRMSQLVSPPSSAFRFPSSYSLTRIMLRSKSNVSAAPPK